MPIRATKRGVSALRLDLDADVLVCGASFAGLTVARELARHRARPRILMVDRYEVGERQTSACAAPTEWLEHLGLAASIQQTFGDLVVHARDRTFRWELPFTFSTFDYRRLCALLLDGCDARFETAKVDGRTGDVVHTDRGDLRAPLIVDALGWRRVLDDDERIQPPEARLSRGLEIHPRHRPRRPDLELWLDPALRPRRLLLVVPRGRRAARRRRLLRPARPRARAHRAPRRRRGRPGRALAGQLDPAPDPARDGRRRLLRRRQRRALPPDDRRGHPPRVPLRARARPRAAARCSPAKQTREQALERYAAFSDAHRWKYDALLRTQDAVGRLNPRPRGMRHALNAISQPQPAHWMFRHYLYICPPEAAAAAAAAAHGGYGRSGLRRGGVGTHPEDRPRLIRRGDRAADSPPAARRARRAGGC